MPTPEELQRQALGNLSPEEKSKVTQFFGDFVRESKPGFNKAWESGEPPMPSTSAQLPKYRCHKEVYALKIAQIITDRELADAENRETDGSALIVPEESYTSFKVDSDYLTKHKPEVGGYYVVYADGYKSFSPAKAFEDGYTLVQ